MLCVSGSGWAAAVAASMSARSSSTAGPCQALPSKALCSCSAMSAAALLFLVDDDRDLALVGGISHSVSVKEQAFARIERQAGGAGCAHDFDGFDADDRDIEAHILIRFGDLDDGKGTAEGGSLAGERAHDLSGALDGRIGAFHGLDGNAGGF